MVATLERLHSPGTLGAVDPHALVGEVVSGRFRVLTLKHAGPRSVVYEVEPPGVGQMRRALKVITAGEAREPDVAERLRTVIRAMRDLDHPCIERVYDVGLLPDESPFIVAEWLPQVSLDRVLSNRRRLPAATALAIVLGAVRGCAALHERGVVHGDVRPTHVLIEMAGEEPQDIRAIKLTDAGVPGVLSMGLTGGAAGQVAYLSPECLSGQARSPASDVYALGVLAYRMLTQVLPYRPEDLRAGPNDRDPVSRVRWLHLNVSPVRPSRLIVPADFSPEVEAVIGRAMAKSLVERYPTAQAMLIALEAALEAPVSRGPGAVAVPLTDELDTQGTSPDGRLQRVREAVAPRVEATAEAAVAPARVPTPAPAAVDESQPTVVAVEAAEAVAPEPASTPARPALWPWAAAGLLSGVLLGLL